MHLGKIVSWVLAGSTSLAIGCGSNSQTSMSGAGSSGTSSSGTGGSGTSSSGTGGSAATCTDGIKNGNETDVDCGGGTCPACPVGKACKATSDCQTGEGCDATTMTCAATTCTDGVQDGTETDVDCGGGTCPGCAVGKKCAMNSDCTAPEGCDATTKTCDANTCSDGVKDGTETDVDCGGGTCPACATGGGCAVGTDCQSLVCTAMTCAAPSCSDLVKNGTETDVDCGGTCPPCADGKSCLQKSDCESASCVNDTCAVPACSPTCSDGSVCGANSDCASDVCKNGLCASPSCAPGCPVGNPCGAQADCASGVCTAGECGNPISCLTLLTAKPGTPSGVYQIDPDGPGGLAPFDVYCDMTTSGGGWTVLPLLFNNPSFWAITHPGNSCITVDIQDNSGDYRQYFSSNTGSFSQTYMKFLPPIPVTTVQFVSFVYTNGGAGNTMDFVVGGLPGATNTDYEAWYFVDAALSPVGYAFGTQAQCLAQGNGEGNYEYTAAAPADCDRDLLGPPIPTALYDMNETVSLSATVPNFNMALIEGCQSALTNPLTDGEQFHIATPPNASGVWQAGIEVR